MYLLQKSLLSIGINLSCMVLSVVYFLQLKYNLSRYLKIDNVKNQLIAIAMLYPIMYLSAMVVLVSTNGKTYKEIPQQDKIISFIVFFISMISIIILWIQQIIMAYKLTKDNSNADIKRMGYSIYINSVLFILVIVFDLIPTLKPYHHIDIIGELLPMYFALKIYRKLLNEKEDNTELESL